MIVYTYTQRLFFAPNSISLQIFFLLIALSQMLYAAEENPHKQASTEHILNERQKYFLTSTDTKIQPKVNPLTGEYCEEELDLVVAGSQPLSVRRFYNPSSPYDPRYATWRYNPESFLVANLEHTEQEIF